ncbi:DUF2125 domain-containing protein [Roseicitreum antarcticum]|uniref:DUF2125 domain-containing protein n=1 Tax=Roseicitreum antarcticum TaxID=564137 RepID=A0A1H2RGL5_9RHOB|nr:DUF2125 domain-containing protein [Roseicitreum antarcticum]SDW18596.1 hypothetical protein SAMN04488238_101310 [Roseicitreum antarcticum]
MQVITNTTARVFYMAAALSLAGSGAALADLTHKQVWEGLREWSLAFDQLAAAETALVEGDTLVLTAVTMTSDADGTRTVFSIPEMRLQQVDADSVTITMSETGDIRSTSEARPFVPATDATLRLDLSNTQITATGAPEQMAFASRSDEIVLTLESLTQDGVAKDVSFEMSFADLAEDSVLTLNEGVGFTSDSRVGAIAISGAGSAAEGESGQFEGQINGFGVTASMENAQLVGESDTLTAAALEAGFAFDANVGSESSQFSFAQEDFMGTSTGNVSMGPSGFGFAMGGTNMAMDIELSALDIEGTSPMSPAPIDYALDELSFSIDMPMVATPDAVPFSAGLRMLGVTLGDEFWSVFDPSAAVPRDPASIIVALSGMGRWDTDIMEDEAMDGEAPGGEVESLAINELAMSVGGAELTGEGAFTFDNDDLTTFDGMPRPEGRMGLTLRGGQSFMNALVAAGMLPQEQAFFGQMMLGALAQAAGEDYYVSEITVTEDGRVLANGQPLPF